MKVRLIFAALPLLFSLIASAETSWENQAEAGIVIGGGNTVSNTVTLRELSTFQWSGNVFSFQGRIFYGSASDVTTARNWDLGVRYERELSNFLSLFVGEKVEGDTFAGYEYRVSTDLGGKYFFLKKEKNFVLTELGYRYTFEDKIDGVQPTFTRSHFIRVFFDGQRAWTKSRMLRVWVEFLPDVSDTDNIQINFEPSFQTILTDVFSLKIAFLGKFDNVPAVPGNKKFDYVYTTSLVADF